MKWKLNITNNTSPKQTIVMSGGYSINDRLGGIGESYRLMILNEGYLDIVDCSYIKDGFYTYCLHFNGIEFIKRVEDNVDITIDISINNGSSFLLGNEKGSLKVYPTVCQEDIDSFNWMMDEKYIPYQNIPDEPGKTVEQIKSLGKLYFPFTQFSFELAMSIYDWTTADFTRIDYFKIFEYTGISDNLLDLDSIAEAIWSADWGQYSHSDKYYMNSFMMKPANSLDDVKKQLANKKDSLLINNNSEINIIEVALNALPRISTLKKPNLFSGQVSIGNLGSKHFATYFKEFPYNWDKNEELEMPLDEALDTFIQPGKSITLKSPMSFTDSLDDAMHYSNGIVLIVTPKEGSLYWEDTTYITPLSDGPNKTEYLFKPTTRFLVKSIEKKNLDKKTITVINLQVT